MKLAIRYKKRIIIRKEKAPLSLMFTYLNRLLETLGIDLEVHIYNNQTKDEDIIESIKYIDNKRKRLNDVLPVPKVIFDEFRTED